MHWPPLPRGLATFKLRLYNGLTPHLEQIGLWNPRVHPTILRCDRVVGALHSHRVSTVKPRRLSQLLLTRTVHQLQTQEGK